MEKHRLDDAAGNTCVVLVGSAKLWSEMAKVRPDSVHMDFFKISRNV